MEEQTLPSPTKDALIEGAQAGSTTGRGIDGRKDGLALVGGHITLLSPPYFWSAYLINEGDAFAWVAPVIGSRGNCRPDRLSTARTY